LGGFREFLKKSSRKSSQVPLKPHFLFIIIKITVFIIIMSKSSSNRLIFGTLNNYSYDDDYLNAVINYLKSGEFQPNICPKHRNLLKKRYGSGDFEIREGDTLFYKPLNLEIVRNADKENKMAVMYADTSISAGCGIVSFYQKVLQRYLGIKRTDVKEFLEKQTTHQLTKKQPRPTNKPVIGEYPNHRWEADLIDLATYVGYNFRKKYIMTVIDCFSKKVFAVPLSMKTPTHIIRGLEKIHAEQSGGIYPIILQTDNGGEFLGEMKAWCVTNNIKQVFTATHTPQSNGLVENFNLHLRKMIREGFVRNNNLNWTRELPNYLEARNTTKHTRIKFTPAQVWTATREPLATRRNIPSYGNDILTQKQIQQRVKQRTVSNAKKTLEKYNDEKFTVGDRVRIKLAAIDTRVRKEIKAGNEKLITVKYTPEVYDVIKIYNPKPNTLQKPQYGTNYSGKRFWANELLKVVGEETTNNTATINVDKLNRF
jgi:transposase InsO family protein